MLRRPLRTFIPLACVLLFPFKSIAAENDTLARQFVELLRFDKQFNNNHTSCLSTSKTVSPEQLIAKDPDSYFGLRPSSPRWPEVLRAYTQYWETICSRPTKEEFLASLASVYAKRLSAKQLRSAIQFYSSPVGQELITAHKAAAANVNTIFSKAYSDMVPEAAAEYNRRLKAIAEAKK